MSLLEAIIMGLIQGITEFLPVSSSGHLALFQIAFDLEETGLLFDCLLHFGTLLAVFAVYFRDIWKMICEGFGIIGDFLSMLQQRCHGLRAIKRSSTAGLFVTDTVNLSCLSSYLRYRPESLGLRRRI